MDSPNKTSTPLDLYQIITDQVIALLEKGVIPWQKPWQDAGMPMNLLSRRPYRGINFWLLHSLNYDKNFFLTWDQIKALGASVNKKEKGHMLVFWKSVKAKPEVFNEDGSIKMVGMLRYYKVFNISQCRDIPLKQIPEIDISGDDVDPLLECEAILNTIKDMPHISFKGNRAFYDVENDEIVLPKMKNFKNSTSYYSTLFHELIHATGAEKRLNRKTFSDRVPFGTECYAQEELIAEMGAAFMCHFTGILPNEIADTASYVQNWLTVLKDDKRFIISAAGQAQKAVDYLLNRDEEGVAEEVEGAKEESVVG
jgi:antirestriction protein ArdC